MTKVGSVYLFWFNSLTALVLCSMALGNKYVSRPFPLSRIQSKSLFAALVPFLQFAFVTSLSSRK